MALAFPVGIAVVAHRVSEPEGLDAAELSAVTTSERPAPDDAAASRSAVVRLPARAFASVFKTMDRP